MTARELEAAPAAYVLDEYSVTVTVEKSIHASRTEILITPRFRKPAQ